MEKKRKEKRNYFSGKAFVAKGRVVPEQRAVGFLRYPLPSPALWASKGRTGVTQKSERHFSSIK